MANRARSARRALEGLAADKAVLVDAAGKRAPVRETSAGASVGRDRTMTPDALEGF